MELGVAGVGNMLGRLSPQQVTELVNWGSVPPPLARGPRLSPCWLLQSLEWVALVGPGFEWLAGRRQRDAWEPGGLLVLRAGPPALFGAPWPVSGGTGKDPTQAPRVKASVTEAHPAALSLPSRGYNTPTGPKKRVCPILLGTVREARVARAPCPMKGGCSLGAFMAFPDQLQVWRCWTPQSPWCSQTGWGELGAGEKDSARQPIPCGSWTEGHLLQPS